MPNKNFSGLLNRTLPPSQSIPLTFLSQDLGPSCLHTSPQPRSHLLQCPVASRCQSLTCEGLSLNRELAVPVGPSALPSPDRAGWDGLFRCAAATLLGVGSLTMGLTPEHPSSSQGSLGSHSSPCKSCGTRIDMKMPFWLQSHLHSNHDLIQPSMQNAHHRAPSQQSLGNTGIW